MEHSEDSSRRWQGVQFRDVWMNSDLQPDHSVCHSVRPDAVPYLWTLTDDPVLALYQGNVRGERVYLQTMDHNILLILCDGFFGSYSCRRAETLCSIGYWKFTLFWEWLPYRHPLYEGTQKHFTTFCFPLSLPHPHSVLLSLFSLLPLYNISLLLPPPPSPSPSHTVMATAEGSSSQVTYDHIFKIILIGDNGVGKSSFIRRFCEGSYVANMETTVGVDFYLSEIDINGKKIKVKRR